MKAATLSSRRAATAARTVSVAAPTGGWNARDSYGNMDPHDAVTLTNWWPSTNSVILRKGYTQHVTGITGQVESLMNYSKVDGTQTLFGAATTKIYDVTSAGAVGAASLSGLTNARWQYINFTNGTNTYLLAVNGADKRIVWDGSAWHKDGDGSPYDVSNVDTATCIDILLFKTRIWMIQSGSLQAWYLPVSQIGGAATALDMRGLFMDGGYIVAQMTWTLDGGYGMDDYLAFITSNGETAVWRLTDPSTPSGIALVGIYNLGAPIGRRCWTKYGSDLLIITRDGVTPMSQALASTRTNQRISITDKIQIAMNNAIITSAANFGWELIQFPKANQLYLNVPVTEGSAQQQYVQNNVTKAWCNFTGWNANCFALLNEDLYFGGNGFVGHAWNGAQDNGATITGTALQSFQDYGIASQKQCTMIRYHLFSDGPPAIFGDVNVDFDLSDRSAQLATTPISPGVWGSAVWGAFTWGSSLIPTAEWQGATGIGYTLAPFLKTGANAVSVQWLSTDLVLELGGVI